VASGNLAILLIEGEAGIGKTRLLKEGLADAAARGAQVAAGAAEELERSRPFGLLARAFGCVPTSGDPRRAAIGAMLSATGSSGESPVTVTSDPGLQFRVVDAFGDLAEDLALSGPVVVGADDLQWADPSSLVTLAAMGRRLAGLPVGIIGCFRPVPRAAELDGAVRALEAAGARHLDASMFVKAFFGRDFRRVWWLLLRADKTGMGRSWWRAGFYQVTKFSSFGKGTRGGRRIVRRPARLRQPISGPGRPGGLGRQPRRYG